MYSLLFQIIYIEIFAVLTILGGLMRLLKMILDLYFYYKKSSLEIKSKVLDIKLKKRKLKLNS